MHLEALLEQQRHQLLGRQGTPALTRYDPGVRRFALAALQRAHAAQIEVLHELRTVVGHVLEGNEHATLHVVGVVAQRPDRLLQRRIGPIPLSRSHGGAQLTLFRIGAAVPQRLVEAADAVARVGDPHQVVRRPAGVEGVGPDAGHAALGQLGDLLVGQVVPLVDGQRIELLVVRPRPGRDVEVVARLVQVVHHGGLPVQIVAQDVAGQRQRQPEAVAVVVVGHVLAPVEERWPHIVVRLSIAIDVHHAIATVRLRRRHDDRDHVLADRLDQRRFLHGEPVGQLHHHLGRPGLGRVEPGGDVVDRFRRGDDLRRLLIRQRPRIGQAVEVPAEALQLGDRCLVGDDHLHHLAPLFGLAHGAVFDARRRVGQRPQVAVDLRRVVQDVGRADDLAEMLER